MVGGARRIEGKIQAAVTLNFVPKQDAEKVNLVTDPSIVEGLLAAATAPGASFTKVDKQGRPVFSLSPYVIRVPRLPAPLVSRLWFHGKGWRLRLSAPPYGDPARGWPAAEGDEWFSIVTVKEGPAEIHIEGFLDADVSKLPAGHHEGFIVFDPAPDLAQKDPAIQRIIGVPIRIPALLEVPDQRMRQAGPWERPTIMAPRSAPDQRMRQAGP